MKVFYEKMRICHFCATNSRRRLTASHPIEVVGEKLREMMPWIRKSALVDKAKN